MSQEQLDQVKQQAPVAKDEAATPSRVEENAEETKVSSENVAATPNASDKLATTTTTAKKKRVKKQLEPVDEQALNPRPSYWPFLLAFSAAVLLLGAVSNLIILGLGVLFLLVSIIGWILERR